MSQIRQVFIYRWQHAISWGISSKLGQAFTLEARLKGIKVQRKTVFYGRPILIIHPGSRVEIGERCSIVSSSRRCSTANLYAPFRIQTSASSAEITIGASCGFNGTSIWCRSSRIEIGNRVMIGPNVTIMDSPGHPISPVSRRMKYPEKYLDEPVTIGDDVWIGNGAIVLAGSSIGKNSVVGAGSVVTGPIPANAVAVGAPARVVRLFDPNSGPSESSKD